jgi:two-component sensor histidine kinase
MVYSMEGKLIRQRLYNDFSFSQRPWLYVMKHNQSDKIYILENQFIELNDKLDVIRTIDLPFHLEILPYQVDINADGEDELLLYSEEEEKLVVYNSGLRKLCEISFKPPSPKWKFSHNYTKNNEHQLFMSSGDKGYLLQLKTNNNFYFSYLVYPGIYLLIFFFILFIRKINTRQVEQRERIKQRLLTLQLQSIKSQLDPHFTFNALNSIASLIYLEEREKAYDYTNKFTRLLRGMLNDAERIYRSLEEELEFVKTYLELEKLRFGDKFNYSMEKADGLCGKELVPKMVLQTFAENAVKHGLMPREEVGFLSIKVELENDYIKLSIEDNGIGRKKSFGKSTSTGKGLKITNEFYKILNQLHEKPISHQITDLYNLSGEPSGTRVEVWVPLVLD